MDIFGYSHKTMDDMGAGIVKRAMTASGSTKSRQSKIPFPKKKLSMRGSFSSKRQRDDFMESQRVAQVLRSGFSQTKTKRRRKSDPEMGKYAPGTLGRKYKPDFKTVKIGPRTSRLRYVDHIERTANHAVYAGFNDVGPVEHLCRSAAEAFLLYYMHKMGDTRANQNVALVGVASGGAGDYHDSEITWGRMRLIWRNKNSAPPTESYAEDDIDHATVSGGVVTVQTFNQMATDLATIFMDRASGASELASVTIFEFDRTGSNPSMVRPRLHDVDAGRHVLQFEAKAKFKIQNTTAADAASDTHNKDNIHANPLDGLVYKFRNRVPKFNAGWMESLQDSTAEALNNLENTQTGSVPGLSYVDLAAQEDVFKVPPPAPYTLFSNSAGRSKILIKPGEHRVLTLKENFEGSVNSFLRKYVPLDIRGDHPNRRVPPGGNCLLIGLKPTFRTGTNEDLEIQTETDRYFAAVLKPRKLTVLPIKNILS